jgi:hypothetical protein
MQSEDQGGWRGESFSSVSTAGSIVAFLGGGIEGQEKKSLSLLACNRVALQAAVQCTKRKDWRAALPLPPTNPPPDTTSIWSHW